MEDGKIIETGFEDLDKRFEGKGLPPGTICSIQSDTNSPANSFLLQLYQNADPNGVYITPLLPADKIKHSLKQLDMNTEFVDGIYGYEQVSKTDDIIEILNNVEFEGGEVVVIGAISEIEEGKIGMNDFYSQLSMIGVEQDVLIMTHHEQSNSDAKLDTYIADAILSLTQTKSGDGITQTLYIERLPPGQRMREMFDGGRAMGLSDIPKRLKISGNTRI